MSRGSAHALSRSGTGIRPVGRHHRFTSFALAGGQGSVTFPWQFQPETYGAKGDTVFFLASVTNGSPNITASTPVFTSTAVDGGKDIMICGAAGTPGGPVIGKILSVQSPTAATLNTSGATVTASGLAAVFSSNDSAALDSCGQAALAYAVANNSPVQILFSKIYGTGTTLIQSTSPYTYNAAVRIPCPASPQGNSTANKLEFQFVSAQGSDGGQNQFWLDPNLGTSGAGIVSYSVGPNTPDPTFGQQSILGGPSGGFPAGANGFANIKAVVAGLTLIQPGWSNSIGLDCVGCSAIHWEGVTSTAFAPSDGTGVNPYGGWINQAFWINNKIAAGYRLPAVQNNDQVVVDSISAQGLNIGILSQADHVIINRLSTNSLDRVIVLALGGNTQHAFQINNASVESYNAGVVTQGTGSKVLFRVLGWDGEVLNIANNDVTDPANQLYGEFYWSDILRSPAVPTISGAANLRVINCQLGPGHMASPPSVPASTVAAAPVYRDATVVVHCGAGVTVSAITVDGTATSQTVAAAASSVPIRVPAGKTIALTYAGGTPTWDWWLD